MKFLYIFGTVLAAVGMVSGVEVGVRAPAPLSIEDCLCQCESQVFTDKFGNINGNCKS